MFGYAMNEVMGRPLTDFVADESIALVLEQTQNLIEGTYELVGKRKNGQRIMLEATGRTYHIGGQRGRIAALRDVTEKRSLEAQFRQAQKMEAVGRLAGGVAHDFNNLLTVIMSYATMTFEDLAADDPMRDDLRAILDAASGAAALTRQLLMFSRRQTVAPGLVAVDDIVANTRKMLTRLIGEDIELVTSLGAENSLTLMDPGQLEQVIMNLVVNSRDAMPDGGVVILETSFVSVDRLAVAAHSPATPGDYVRLTVRDTGAGMDAETQAHAFEPFFTTKAVGKGTGLGLSMVYGIVHQCRGFIEVESVLNTGTAFHIYLPLATTAAEADQLEQDDVADLRGTETVLLAEDSASVRATVVESLQRYGYTVIAATTSTEALHIAAVWRPHIDLLLTDLVMPGVSGRELAAAFIRLRPDSRVLFMSGYTDDAELLEIIQAQSLPMLQKPFTPSRLAHMVREVLAASVPGVAP